MEGRQAMEDCKRRKKITQSMQHDAKQTITQVETRYKARKANENKYIIYTDIDIGIDIRICTCHK